MLSAENFAWRFKGLEKWTLLQNWNVKFPGPDSLALDH